MPIEKFFRVRSEAKKNVPEKEGKVLSGVEQQSVKTARKRHLLRTAIAWTLLVYEGIRIPLAIQDPFPPAQFQQDIDSDQANPDQQINTKEAKKSKEAIEKAFGIRLIGPEENPSTIQSEFGQGTKPLPWTPENLETLQEILNNLPPSFYQPMLVRRQYDAVVDLYKDSRFLEWTKKGLPADVDKFDLDYPEENTKLSFTREQLQSAIDNFSKKRGNSFYFIGTPKQTEILQELKIQFLTQPIPFPTTTTVGEFRAGNVYREITDENSSEVFTAPGMDGADRLYIVSEILIKKGINYLTSFSVHEFTHRIFDDNPELYSQKIYTILEVSNERKFKDLMNKKNYLATLIRNLPENLWREKSLASGLIKGTNDVYNLKYGITNVNEFNSVMAQFYIRGEENFLSNYEPFVGKEKAQKLYEYMKEHIFEGKEYGN